MFDYPIITEEEAMKERFQLLKDGQYSGVIKKVTHKMSSSQNNMFEVDMEVYDDQGCPHMVKDFLVFTKSMIWKVIHCAESSGTFAEYEQKKFMPEVLMNKNVIVSVRTQEGKEIPPEKLKGKPPGSRYPTKNVIEDYLKKSSDVNSNSTSKDLENELNDEIPF